MNKLKQIKALVEEAMTELESNTRRTTRAILTDLAKRSAEIGDVDQPALQPLPDNAPEWLQESLTEVYNNRMDMRLFYSILKRHFGTQPREWWMDLKKGDKFMYGDGIDGEIRTFNGHYSCIEDNYFLYSMEEGDSIGIGVGNCTPYTDPEAEFIATLTPEQLAMYKHVKEGKG